MVPPIYDFYIGTALSLTMLKDRYIDPNTGQPGSAINSVSSYPIDVDSELIFVNYNPSRDIFDEVNNILIEALLIYMYDAAGTYLGWIIVNKANLYTLKKNTKSIIVEFISYSSDIRRAHRSFVKNGFSEVYEMRPVVPHYTDLSKKYAKENGQAFFRVSLEGNITVYGKDYEYIKDSSLEDTLAFVINKLNADEYDLYYAASFNKTDCQIDHAKKSCQLKLTTMDAYNKVLDKYEDTYDLIKLAPELSRIDMYKRMQLQVYVRGANSVTNLFGGTYWEEETSEAIDDHNTLVNKYHFAYVASGNEFYVEGAEVIDANGVYAGINGEWINPKGYTAYINPTSGGMGYLEIKHNSTGQVIYQSVNQMFIPGDVHDVYILDTASINMHSTYRPGDTFTIDKIFLYHFYQRVLCDVSDISLGPSGSITHDVTYDLPLDDFATSSQTNYKKCIGLEGQALGQFYCTARTVEEPTRFGQNDYNQYFTNEFIPFGAYRPLPVSRNSWANASLWFSYSIGGLFDIYESRFRKKYTLNDSFYLADAIQALLGKINPTIRHNSTEEYSQFFYGNQLIDTFGVAEKFYVHIVPKSNILKGNYDQPAQKAEITFKELMDMLCSCFRCYWYIENNKLKIEHISFFMNGGSYTLPRPTQLDFTELKDQFNKKLTAYGQEVVSYDKNDLAARYEFGWMDDVTELFSGPNIDVKSKFVQKDKIESINVSQFSSDVDFMLFNPSNFSDDGFALLCPIKVTGNRYELPIVTATLFDSDDFNYQGVAQNFYASWKYLTRFYMYDMPAYNISFSEGIAYDVVSIKKSMTHSLKFPSANDPDEQQLIKTAIGMGEIDNMSISLNTRMVEAELRYKPE